MPLALATVAAAWLLLPRVGISKEPTPAAEADAAAAAAESLTPAKQWEQRFKAARDRLYALETEREDMDALYEALMPVLIEQQNALWAAFSGVEPTGVEPEFAVTGEEEGLFKEGTDREPKRRERMSTWERTQALRKEVSSLYRTRLLLLEEITPELHAKVTGLDLRGAWELRTELRQVLLDTRYLTVSIPKRIAQLPERARGAPFYMLVQLFQLGVLLLVFRWWRRWAPGALARLQNLFRDKRTRQSLRLARMVWYLERIRAPFEWLVFFALLIRSLDFFELPDLAQTAWSFVFWFYFAWLATRLLNAIAARGSAGLRGEHADLRLRSLRLVVTWFVILGLGLDLAYTYAGAATLYAWVWLVFKLLTLPVLLLLVVWWRSNIFRRLEAAEDRPPWIEKELKRQRGPRSYLSAALGAGYLAKEALREQFLGALTEMEWGRRAAAHMYRRSMARDRSRGARRTDRPIPMEAREQILTAPDEILEPIGRTELAAVKALVDRGDGRLTNVIAERGGGKTVFLRRLLSRYDETALLFDCPADASSFFEAFARALGADNSAEHSRGIEERLRDRGITVVGLDNVHRLSRPVLGGQRVMDEAFARLQQLPPKIHWVTTIDANAWHYIRLVRAQTIFGADTLELPAWTEEQIGELIELRCRAAGIEPDYTRLAMPRFMLESTDVPVTERNRVGFMRILWDLANGNPEAALRMFADALSETDASEIVALLPELPSTPQFDTPHPTLLIVLRVILQADLATLSEIVESVRIPVADTRRVIHLALEQGWIEEIDGSYRVSWQWYRSITRTLARQNMLGQP